MRQVCVKLAKRFNARGGDKTKKGFKKMVTLVHKSDGLIAVDNTFKSKELQMPP